MKIFRITMLVVAIALIGSSFTVDAKVKKRRHKTKTEKKMQQKEKTDKSAKAEQCILDMVEYEYGGMRMYPVSKVRVERKDGKVVLVSKGTVTDEKEFVIADGEQLLKDALTIIEEEKMLEYGVSYDVPPEMQPLDGYAWWFSAKLADGRSITSRGRNAGPEGEGLHKIEKLLFGRARELMGLENYY